LQLQKIYLTVDARESRNIGSLLSVNYPPFNLTLNFLITFSLKIPGTSTRNYKVSLLNLWSTYDNEFDLGHDSTDPEDEFAAALEDCNEEDVYDDLTEEEFEYDLYSEYSEENTSTVVLVDFQQAIEASQPVTTSWLDEPKFPSDNASVHTDGSWSGSSHQESDMEDIEIACQEGIALSFLEPHETIEPPAEVELPECFHIPFDPEIAEIALEETLQSLGISHCPYPPNYNALDLQTWEIAYGPEHAIDMEAAANPFEGAKWSKEFYQLDADRPTPSEPSRPTFVEEYNSALPTLTEETWCMSSVDFEELQALTASRMQEKGLEPVPDAFSADLSYIFDTAPTPAYKVPYPAHFISVLPDPEPVPSPPVSPSDEYGDGSQFLVEFEDEEPSGEPIIPIFTEEDFLPESERRHQIPFLSFEDYPPLSEPELYAFNSYEPTQLLHSANLDFRIFSQSSAYPQYQPTVQTLPHLPPISSMDPDGIGATDEQSSSIAQNLIDFLVSLPGSLVSSVTSLIGSSSNTSSTGSKSTPETQHLSPLDFSDSDSFKEELTAYANLRVYGTTSSPYDDPNYYPNLW
jgi:hypothetical protein